MSEKTTGAAAASSTSAPFDWREDLDVHPAAKQLRPMSKAEFARVAEDIKLHGIKVPPILWSPADGSAPPVLIDGCSRLDILAQLGLLSPHPTSVNLTIDDDGFVYPFAIVEGEWHDRFGDLAFELRHDPDPWALVATLNVHRRQLSNADKRKAIDDLIAANPKKTDRQIAEQTGTSPSTVGARRKEAEANVQNGHKKRAEPRVEASGRKARGPKPGRKQPKPAASGLAQAYAACDAAIAARKAKMPVTGNGGDPDVGADVHRHYHTQHEGDESSAGCLCPICKAGLLSATGWMATGGDIAADESTPADPKAAAHLIDRLVGLINRGAVTIPTLIDPILESILDGGPQSFEKFVEIVEGKTSNKEQVETWAMAIMEQLADQKLAVINSDGLWELGPSFKLGESLVLTPQHGEIGPVTVTIFDKERRTERNQRSLKRMAIVQLQHEIAKLFDRAINVYSEDLPPQEEAAEVVEKIDETVVALRALRAECAAIAGDVAVASSAKSDAENVDEYVAAIAHAYRLGRMEGLWSSYNTTRQRKARAQQAALGQVLVGVREIAEFKTGAAVRAHREHAERMAEAPAGETLKKIEPEPLAVYLEGRKRDLAAH
jgi:hypothetical protein